MTTAARPTWAPAKGGNEQGGTRIFGPSQKFSSRDLAAHTTLKPRQWLNTCTSFCFCIESSSVFDRKEGQDTKEELQKRNLREELEERERRHFSSKDKSYNDDRDRRRGNQLLLEGTKRDAEDRIIPRSVDADDSDVEVNSEDDSCGTIYSLELRRVNCNCDEEALMAELERIKKERAEEKLRQDQLQMAEELKVKEEQLLRGNPLLNNATTFNVKRRWDDDVVFKNQARGESKTPKRFINDTIRIFLDGKFYDVSAKLSEASEEHCVDACNRARLLVLLFS
ncbi:hypothetical protein DKX38_025571 [Salix brachista]|uniref:Uncharacterized protein n=1 Tax=Salix brachista TaxID=2182728 RepID=A0A5N5JQ36_9ROSI|nr:hypothetical protein DKX38_025571 [Salix brachista]